MKFITQIGLMSMFMIFMVSCKKENKSAVTGEAAPVAEAVGTEYSIVQGRSLINWSGSKLAGTHTGTFQVSKGTVSVDNGKVTGGNFTIDMNSLICTDLAAGQGKEKLEGHLKSADFFDVAAHPEATFEITKVTALEGSSDANSLIYGNLTMKGVSKQVGFKAMVNNKGNGITVTTPEFSINRTDFGMTYGSASLTDTVKDKAINDEVKLSITLGAM